MKKLLAVGALALAIVSSMVAGTLAIYSTTVDDQTGNVHTKAFDVNLDSVTTPDISIAPGESDFWKFNVTNVSDAGVVSEVPIATNVAVTVPQELLDAGIVVKMARRANGASEEIIAGGTSGNVFEFTDPAAFQANVSGTSEYTMTFEWPADGKDDAVHTAAQNMTKEITVSISGKQVIS